MKAIVVEIKDKYAIVMEKSGSFVKVKRKANFYVGHEVEISTVTNMSLYTNSVKRIASLAAAAVFIFGGLGYGGYTYATPYSYISVDINPSVEITTNVYDRIIRIKGVNQDGEKLLSLDNYFNKTIEDGIDTIIDEATKNGYLTSGEKNTIVFTVSGKDNEKIAQLENEVKEAAASRVEKDKTSADITMEKVPKNRLDDARAIGITPGKLNLIEKALQQDPTLKMEDLKDRSIKEIMKTMKKDGNKLSGSDQMLEIPRANGNQKQNEQIAPVNNKPVAPTNNKPVVPIITKPVEPTNNKPVAPTNNKPVVPAITKPVEPIINKPVAPINNKPVEPIINKPVEPIINKPGEPINNKPGDPVINIPVDPVNNKPVVPVFTKPAEPVITVPAEPGITKPVIPVNNKPSGHN